MKCHKIRETLTDYLRQETDSQITAAVTSHLETCDDCARELAFLKVYHAKIGSLSTTEAPNHFLVNIKQRLDQPKDRESLSHIFSRRARPIFRGPIPQLSGALVGVLIVILVFHPFQLGQRIRQDAKTPSAAQTAPKDESKEITTFGLNQPQSKSAPESVMEDQTNAANGVVSGDDVISGGERQKTGERRIIFTMRQPALRANKALTDVGADTEKQNLYGETEADQDVISEKSVLKKEESPTSPGFAIILTVKTLIKSVAGEIVQEEINGENGQSSLFIRIPAQNYSAFLEKLREIGSVDGEGSVPPNHPQFIEARLILKGIF